MNLTSTRHRQVPLPSRINNTLHPIKKPGLITGFLISAGLPRADDMQSTKPIQSSASHDRCFP
jgi:hypothetical protein